MSTRATVIVNRAARWLQDRGPLLDALTTPRNGLRIVETHTLEDLDAAARGVAASPPDAVILAGGDGSAMAGVTALERAMQGRPLPAIGLAPGGTVCTVGRNWGMTQSAPRYAKRLLDGVARGSARPVRRPTLRVTDDTGATRVGFIVGAGLVSRFFEVYEARGAPGYAGAARIVARIFGGSFVGGALARRVLTPVRCAIDVDGARAPLDQTSLFCASVVRDLGLHMHLLYRAGEEEERFHVVATPLGPLELGPQMPLVLLGRRLLGRHVDALAREVVLTFDAPDAYVLDGELLFARSIAVTAGPVIRVLSV